MMTTERGLFGHRPSGLNCA